MSGYLPWRDARFHFNGNSKGMDILNKGYVNFGTNQDLTVTLWVLQTREKDIINSNKPLQSKLIYL